MSTEAATATKERVECPKCHTTNQVASDADAPKCEKCGHDLSETIKVVSQEHGPKRQAVEKLAEGKEEPTEDEIVDATEWFLGQDEDEGERAVKTLEIDVGISKPKIIRWVVGSLDRDRIAEIRREAREIVQRRHGKRRGMDPLDESPEMIANVRIAVEGTISPDFSDDRVRGKFADPADAMRHRFKAKSGLIDQIAGHVILLSGFSSEDVQEVDAVKG